MAVILSIGTELTRGELVNTNAAWLGEALTALGFEVTEVLTVDDHKGRIIETLERLGRATDVIVCTGGLGPTTDDLTTEAVATALGKRLVRDSASLDAIRRRFERFQRTMTPSNEKQADFPEGAEILPNPNGTAPGFSIRLSRALAFFMPGVPREMRPMFEDEVVPRIRSLSPNDHYQVRLSTFGLPESAVGEKLAGLEAALPGLTIGYRAHFPEIEVKLHVRAAAQSAARDLVERAVTEVRARLGDVIFGEGGESLPVVFSRELRRAGKTISLAESCTGGLVASLLTREPGASEFLKAGVVAYANAAKTKLLGVSEEVIRGHGAVSSEVAAAMAEGVRYVAETDIGVGITGIAGPTGGSEEKPVGTVFLAVASAGGTVVKRRVLFGDRVMIQTLAAYAAMSLVREGMTRG